MNALAWVLGGVAAGIAWGSHAAASGPPAPPKPSGGLPPSGDASSSSSFTGGGGGGGATGAWFDSLPKDAGPAREAMIFDAFNRGFTRAVTWVTIRSTATIAGAVRTLDFDVMDDCLCVGSDTDWIRVSMSARTQQAIADTWPDASVVLCTSKIADLIAENAEVRLPPMVMSARSDIGIAHMSETWVMREYNNSIEQARAGRAGLVSDAGKYWVRSKRLDGPAHVLDHNGAPTSQLASANYGFFVTDSRGNYAPKGPVGSHVGTGGWSHGPGGWAVWQNVGLAHNLDHADYSQTCRLAGRRAVLDGTTDVDMETIARDPALCVLVSDEGPLSSLRIPAIPPGALLAT